MNGNRHKDPTQTIHCLQEAIEKFEEVLSSNTNSKVTFAPLRHRFVQSRERTSFLWQIGKHFQHRSRQ